MYRVTNLDTGFSRIVIEPHYVQWGENGWEECDKSEYISVREMGVCIVYDDTKQYDDDLEYPLVRMIKDDGLAIDELHDATSEHTTQITSLESDANDILNTMADEVLYNEDAHVVIERAIVEDAIDTDTRILELEERISVLEALVSQLGGNADV